MKLAIPEASKRIRFFSVWQTRYAQKYVRVLSRNPSQSKKIGLQKNLGVDFYVNGCTVMRNMACYASHLPINAWPPSWKRTTANSEIVQTQNRCRSFQTVVCGIISESVLFA